jgi:hypothetical protein
MPWKMFLIEETEFCRLSIRRFTFSQKPCPGGQYGHDAQVVIDPQVISESERSSLKDGFENDPRWPKTCSKCGYVFVEEDQWQVNYDRLYRGAPDGKLYRLRDTPPGAMWNAHWMAENDKPNGQWTGPDGKAWCVMMPGGVEWVVYCYASGPEPRRKWDVQGIPPNITVSPSINLTGIYHGFIKGGVISADCEGRKFPNWPSTV